MMMMGMRSEYGRRLFHALVTVGILSWVASASDVYSEKAPSVSVSLANFQNFSESASFIAGTKQVDLKRYEKESGATATWESAKNNYSTRYSIVGLSSRLGGDDLYIAGVLQNNESLIERWQFNVRAGRWSHSQSGATTAIGTPGGSYAGSVSIAGGGSYVPLGPVWIAPTISTVIQSSAYGTIRSIAVDPQGRYLLFSVFPSGDVYRLDLSNTSAPPTVIFSHTSIAQLANCGSLLIAQHSDFGRVCIASPANPTLATKFSSNPEVVYLQDANNDGVFESSAVVPLAGHLSSLRIDVPGIKWSWPWSEQW